MSYFISNLKSKLSTMGLELIEKKHRNHSTKSFNVDVLQLAYNVVSFLQTSGASLKEFHVDIDKSGTTRVWIRDVTKTLEFSFNELELDKVGFKSYNGHHRDLTKSMQRTLESYGIQLTQKAKDSLKKEMTKYYTLTGNTLQDNLVMLQMAATMSELTATL